MVVVAVVAAGVGVGVHNGALVAQSLVVLVGTLSWVLFRSFCLWLRCGSLRSLFVLQDTFWLAANLLLVGRGLGGGSSSQRFFSERLE